MLADRRQFAALKRGADNLMNLGEYVLRDDPRMLGRVRERYRGLCAYLHRVTERSQRAKR